MPDLQKPPPRPELPDLTRPFWEAARRRELIIPRCPRCAQYFWYPREVCPSCLEPGWEWTPVSGRGRLHSYTVVRQPLHPAFQDDVPYAYAMVQLEEGVRLISNIVGCRIPDDLAVEMPVEAVFEDFDEEWTLVKFRPATGAEDAGGSRPPR